MKYLLTMCLPILLAVLGVTPFAATQSATTTNSSTPPLQKGIHVQLPVTSSAVPIPDADKPEATIVSITEDGNLYLGINPITVSALSEKLKIEVPGPSEKPLYLKADARTPYANLVNVLDAVHKAGINAVTLLTSQRRAGEAGSRTSPEGLELQIAPGSAIKIAE